jgi:hypothetical protein
MTFLFAAAALLSAGAALAAKPSPLATPAPPSGAGLPSGQCFRSQDIQSHSVADRQTMLIKTRQRDTYRVTMKGGCLAGAIPSDPIITRSPPGSSMICRPLDMDLAISRGGFETPCIVDSIAKMNPDEVAALPSKIRP